MKTKYSTSILCFLLFCNIHSFAQQTLPHQPERPPLNPGYPFSRGMYVDCADKIIYEVAAGETYKLQKELNDYINKNYITYIILCGIEHANILGNSSLESALQTFMIRTRNNFPGIKIGLAGSDAETFQNTPSVTLPPQFNLNCLPIGPIVNINNLKDAVNDPGVNSINLKKSELCKFFFRAALFGYQTGLYKYATHCNYAFDAFYLQYRYWNATSSLASMQNEFLNFKTILSVMKVLKYNYGCIRNIDAEFQPTEIFTLQAWTAIDQIDEADPLADRLMIPAFTNNSTGVFDNVCKSLHFLSDRFSKLNSTIFIELSAESSSFKFCNSTTTPQNHLGNYLNGFANPSGNMYSVEKLFIDKLNDPNYKCLSCGCKSYPDNHFSATNPSGNSLIGVMWGPFSMLKKNNLFKTANTPEIEKIKGDPIKIELFDLSGRLIKSYATIEESSNWQMNNSLPEGIYLMKMIYSDESEEVKKIVHLKY